MNTYEMLKVIEGTNKTFVDQYGNRIAFEEDGYLYQNTGQVFMITRDILKNSEWEEVKEPVSFLEAVKASKVGKIVTADLEGYKVSTSYSSIDSLLITLGSRFESFDLVDLLKDTKFYIED